LDRPPGMAPYRRFWAGIYKISPVSPAIAAAWIPLWQGFFIIKPYNLKGRIE